MKKKHRKKPRMAKVKKMLETPVMSGAFSFDSEKLKRRIDTYASVEPKPHQPRKIEFSVAIGPSTGKPLAREFHVGTPEAARSGTRKASSSNARSNGHSSGRAHSNGATKHRKAGMHTTRKGATRKRASAKR